MSVLKNWFEEKQSAWLYRQLAEMEPDGTKSQLFTDLADAAESQAVVWDGKIKQEGRRPPPFIASRRARLVVKLLRLCGIPAMRPVLSAMKIRGLSIYTQSYAPSAHPMPDSVEDIGRRHRGYGGGTLRAAVFGASDGLVSNTCLVMGVGAALHETGIILTTGVAGLAAGAFSMAAGEYISMRSQREMYEYQIGLEREELDEYPEEEAEELALIYQARGMGLDEARRISRGIISQPDKAMDVLSREELGLNPNDLGSPWGAAASSFLSFSIGASVPLLPLAVFPEAATGLVAAGVASGLSLFFIGVVLSLFTGRNALKGGGRMLGIGGAAGVVTFGIGYLLGAPPA